MSEVLNKEAYGKLLADIQPRIISTEEENEHFLSVIETFMALGENLTPEQESLVNLLVILVETFEKQHYRLEEATPHEVLKELMQQRNLKQKDLLPIFKSKGIASEVINGKRTISKAQAKLLGEFFNVSPLVFI